jgi:26S proteasome regulatory subunit T3
MGDVLVESTVNQVLPHHVRKQQLVSSIPNIDSLEADGGDEYSTMKKLQRHLEYVM